MQNPEEELKKYRRQIFQDLAVLLNFRFQLLTELTDNKNRVLWEALSGVFSVIYQSLFENLIITLSWLYSESKEDRRSLIWYLKQVKSHTQIFSDSEIEKQLEKIDQKKDIVAKLKTVRDKWIAHRDPIAFNNPNEFLNVNKIELQDFEILIKLAEGIIQEHYNKFEDTQVVFDIPTPGIYALCSSVEARKDLLNFLTELDTSIGKTDAEDRKNIAIDKLLQKHSLHPKYTTKRKN